MTSLFDKIIDRKNLYMAYKKTQEGDSKYKHQAMVFAQNESANLLQLREKLINNTWDFGGYVEFKVYEPKVRLIHAPSYESKIVQLAIHNIIKDIYFPKFIYHSYACIDDKGTHQAVNAVSKNMYNASYNYGEEACIIKLDIKKFFYSIDRKILKRIIKKTIKCKDTKNLIFSIIDSADQISELGLPLGNTLSQLFANVYMSEFDQFCKRELKLHYYIRYADDVVAIVSNKQIAKSKLKEMEKFLIDKLNLVVSPTKTKIFPISQGVNAYGFKININYRLLRNDSKKKIKRKLKKFPKLIREGRIDISKVELMLNSWRGHAIHGDSRKFVERLLEKFDYLTLNDNGTFKIDKDKLQ